ncbi:motility-associated protein [Vibrio sp. PNB22_3_1]
MQRFIAAAAMVFIVFGGFVMMGGQVGQIIKPVDIFIIFGVGVAGMVMSCDMNAIKLGLRQIRFAFSKGVHSKEYYDQLLSLLFELIQLAKTEGIKVVDKVVENPDESEIFKRYPLVREDSVTENFIIDSFRLVVAGNVSVENMGNLKEQLDAEISELKEQYMDPSHKFYLMGDSLPAVGITCAVMALVLTMQKLDADIYTIGSSIAGALVGTLTGIVGCYCVVGPLSGAAGDVAKKQIEPLYCVKSAVLQYVYGSSAHLCVNAARKHIALAYKPSFNELEDRVRVLKDVTAQSSGG